ncbi:MAG: PIN domain-containing protein [Moorella humiferrea]|nr:PIN domain-containing protein [Moorella humiferrea]
MNASIFVDTNIMVYAYDRSEPEKQVKALQILDLLATRKIGAISAQVLAEFFVTVTRKIKEPLTLEQAQKRIQNYLASWTVLDVTPLIIIEAVRGVREYQLSYWDAQIWATARLNQISTVFSEDFATGSILEGISFVNPFAADFDLASWL